MDNGEYFGKLEEEVKVERARRKTKAVKYEKTIKSIDNDSHRRSCYHKRSNSILLAARELEIQCHCKVAVHIKPTWPSGKSHSYVSQEMENSPVPVIPPATVSAPASINTAESVEPVKTAAQATEAVKGSLCTRKHPVFKVPLLSPGPSVTTVCCRLCGDSQESSFWLGCGFRNPKTKRQDCNYWVHQNCVGLFFSTEKELSKVPFFCRKHSPSHGKKNN